MHIFSAVLKKPLIFKCLRIFSRICPQAIHSALPPRCGQALLLTTPARCSAGPRRISLSARFLSRELESLWNQRFMETLRHLSTSPPQYCPAALWKVVRLRTEAGPETVAAVAAARAGCAADAAERRCTKFKQHLFRPFRSRS
ncbi:protein of unknown function [Cupriavidus taiwanensis]|nr:protein of unknown function [Cupriavidus taiwanensis]